MYQPINIEILDRATDDVLDRWRCTKIPETGKLLKIEGKKRLVVERLIKLNNDVIIWVE